MKTVWTAEYGAFLTESQAQKLWKKQQKFDSFNPEWLECDRVD